MNMEPIRIGLLGGVDAGKSSLLGVLKKNILDDGKGSSRKYIMTHKHEKDSGRTSSVNSQYIDINDKLITFVDLAGHETYLKTSIYGLYGLNLDFICIIIGSNMGVNKMTKEHFYLVNVLKLPIIFIITKIDLVPEHILNNTYNDLNKLIKNNDINKKSLNIINLNKTLEEDNILYYDEEKDYLYLNKEKEKNIKIEDKDVLDFEKYYPLFFISNKNGFGLKNLRDYFYNLHNSKIVLSKKSINNKNKNNNENDNIFIIQNTYNVSGIGLVFFGYVKYGIIKKSDILHIGPFNGQFYKINIKNIRNIYDNDVLELKQNSFGCLAIKQLEKHIILKKNNIRKGIYCTNKPFSSKEFIAKVYILHHPTTIKPNYQSTIHCGTVSQTAKISEIINIKTITETDGDKILRTGDVARVKFVFLFRPEYIEKNSLFVFRENNAKGIGKIISVN